MYAGGKQLDLTVGFGAVQHRTPKIEIRVAKLHIERHLGRGEVVRDETLRWPGRVVVRCGGRGCHLTWNGRLPSHSTKSNVSGVVVVTFPDWSLHSLISGRKISTPNALPQKANTAVTPNNSMPTLHPRITQPGGE